MLAVNTLGFERREPVELPAGVAGGQSLPGGRALGVVTVPPVGLAVMAPEPVDDAVTAAETADGFVLENAHLRATFGRDGRLHSLWDRAAQREAVAPGERANELVLFDDHPNRWDAWDVDVFHLEKRAPLGEPVVMRLVERGPLRACIEAEYEVGRASRLVQRIVLTATGRYVAFECRADWREAEQFLKVEFPCHVHAPSATYEIQFGHLQRPTHFNTSWDVARFEVCGHRWADLSEADYGVAVLNDCKYGYGAQGHVLRLSLLRAPKAPDPQADMGEHAFTYAVMPHAGSLQQAGVIEAAYALNVPLLTAATDREPVRESWLRVDRPGVVIDTVKRSEDGESVIVRLYEAHGTRGTVRLESALPVRGAARCNLLERADEPLEWADGGVSFEVTPFRLETIKLTV